MTARTPQPEDRWLGQWLANRRRGLGVTQDYLAGSIDAHQTTIAKFEAGRQNISYWQVVRLARALQSPALPFAPDGLCQTCAGFPPDGFTCNVCGKGGDES